MEFLPLLGKHLKDDEVLNLLERLEVQVVYDFDRLHENTPDQYWAAAEREGFQLHFDAEQRLDALFLYIEPLEGFAPVDRAELDVPLFSDLAELESHAASTGLRLTKGRVRGDGALADRDWGRIDDDSWSIHYDYRAGVLAVVTVSLPRADG
jgi:hypothetical protein